MDYRVILRRFEFDRLMMPRNHRRPQVGYPFLHNLLGLCRAIQRNQLYEQFMKLPTLHRTLYAIYEFDSQVVEGGIQDFFVNIPPTIWFEAEDAFQRIGAHELLEKYRQELEKQFGNKVLNELRQAISDADDCSEFHSKYCEFRESLDGSETQGQFNSTHYRLQDRSEFDKHLRSYLQGRESELVRICDGNEALEREWFDLRLRKVIAPIERWRDLKQKNPNLQVVNLQHTFIPAFTSTAQRKLGFIESSRTRKAHRILQSIYDRIQDGEIHVGLMSFDESPTPHVNINLGKTWFGPSRIVIEYSESDMGKPTWKINRWR